jgi:Holliday junction resolvase RusA-like endonuclease
MWYVIPLDPIPLARARHGRGRTWDSQKTEKFAYALHVKRQHGVLPLLYGPLCLELIFYMPIPQCSGKKRSLLEGAPHYKRPDLSNMIKFVEDVCIGILYKDDSFIYKIVSSKIYSSNPRIEFRLISLGE